MKKRWMIFISILVVIGIAAWNMYNQNQKQQKATEDILNHVQQVDEVTISNGEKSMTFKGKEATPFIESTPLVHIEKYERTDRNYFEKEPRFIVSYKVKGKTLYAVELLQLKKKLPNDRLNDFLMNEHLLVKWQGYPMMFSQHEAIQLLVDAFNAKEK